MGIPCSDLLRLPDLDGLELVGGRKGLGREVLWVHIGDGVGALQELDGFLNGHELIFLTGKGLGGRLEEAQEALPRLNRKHVAGVVINVGPYFPGIPEELAALADELELPLFSLPWKYKLVDVTRAVCNAIIAGERQALKSANLLEEILFGTPPGEELRTLLARAGVEGAEYVVGVLGTAPGQSPESTRKALQLRRQLYSLAVTAFADTGVPAIFMQRGSGSTIFLCAAGPRFREKLERAVKTANARFRASGGSLRMGAGEAASGSEGLRRSYVQARQALKCAAPGALALYSRLGLDALLLEMPDRERMAELVQETLGPVLAYDAAGGSCLYRTLEVCFDCNMDLRAAAEALFVHRNTVRYRLSKIEELLGLRLHDVQSVELLGVCLRIARLLGQEDEE